jgi:tetratricopeptide (TPR) repeat protein
MNPQRDDPGLKREWTATYPTSLKASAALADDLPATERLDAPFGARLSAVLVGEEQDYWIIGNGFLDNEAIAENIRFVYKGHWALLPQPKVGALRVPDKSYCICISGQMRLYEKVFAGLRKLFEGADATFVVSVWDLRGGKMLGALNPHQCERMFPVEVSSVIPPTCLYDNFYRKLPGIKVAISTLLEKRGVIAEGMIREYFPDAIVEIENDDVIAGRLAKLASCSSEVANSYRMHYKIARANDIKRELEACRGSAFDVVIRTRPDRPLHNLEMPADIGDDGDVVYIDWLNNAVGDGDAGDQVAIGSSAALDRYSSMFQVFDRRLEEDGRTNFWSGAHRELASHIKAQGLQPRPILPVPPQPMEEYLDAAEFVAILRADEKAAKPPLKAELTHFRASIEANVLLAAGELEKALAKCDEGLAAQPELPGAWYVRSRILRKQGRLPEALDAANNALRFAWWARNDYFFITDLIYELVREVDIEQGLIVAERHCARAANIPLFFVEVGILQARRNSYELALQSFRKAVEIDPNHRYALDEIRRIEGVIAE